ncbi:MAG TPA: 4-Cys prefix domain-containing protein [Allocoleopsis sp.]
MAPQSCYCINPNCPDPGDPGNNIPTNKYCIKCGCPLLLNNKYRSSRLLSSNSGFGLVFEVFSGFDVKILKVLKPDWNNEPLFIY